MVNFVPNCPVCQSAATFEFSVPDRNRRIGTDEFRYFSCPSCSLFFLYPIPQDLGHYYPDDYYQVPETINKLDALADGLEYQIDMIKAFVPQGKLLEIGPAYGAFSRLAKRKGYDVEVIEMDSVCCEYLDQVVGVKVKQSNRPEEILPQVNKKDVIALWHVIEHLPNPWEVLEKATEALAPNGLLTIACPNPEAFQFKVLRSYWPHIDAPRHLQLIPISLLVKKMKQLGLKVVLLTTTDPGGLRWNIFGWEKMFLNFFPQPILQLPIRILARLASFVAAPFDRQDRKGSAYTVFFQKVTP